MKIPTFTQISIEAIKNVKQFEINEEFILPELLGPKAYNVNEFDLKKVEKYLIQLIWEQKLKGVRYDLSETWEVIKDQDDNAIFTRIPNDIF